jgi:hypothetical protein
MKKLNQLITGILIILGSFFIYGQSVIDIGVGISQQDDFAVQATYRNQFTERFRAGIQIQYGLPNYRFVSAITFQDKGYSSSISIPLTFRLNNGERIQLSLFIKPGLRFQGIIDPDENNAADSLFRSSAVTFEPGLLLNFPVGEKLSFQSGITFPIFYEVKPTTLFENQATLIHGGLNYAAKNNMQAFLKMNMGPAFGASGDTQKFLWSAQVGLRLVFGNKKNSIYNPIIESSL